MSRTASVERNTLETQIQVSLSQNQMDVAEIHIVVIRKISWLQGKHLLSRVASRGPVVLRQLQARQTRPRICVIRVGRHGHLEIGTGDIDESITLGEINEVLAEEAAAYESGDFLDVRLPSELFVMVVHERGRWFVSPLYTSFEYVRTLLDLPPVDYEGSTVGLPTGTDSASGVLQVVVDQVNGFDFDAEVDAAQLDMEVEDKKTAASSRRYPIYRCTIENEVIYCVPIIGRGLWSKLYGYLSLESDLNTVKGITFYKHGETPGLGAEIEKGWFQDNFVGKKINDQTGTFISIEVVKGKAAVAYAGNEEKLSHAVDGISGATITSRGVTKMLHEDLTKYVPYFKQLEAN